MVFGVLLLVAGLIMAERRYDTAAFHYLQHMTSAVAPTFWSAWSVLGLGVCAALLAALASGDRMGPITVMLWSLLLGGLGLQIVKHLWVLPRPASVLPPESFHLIGLRLHAGSMPSGHAAMLIALACALARPLWPRWPALAVTLFLLGAIGAVARIAVGVHWPSDVLVGAAVGLFSVAAGDAVDARWSLRRWLSTPLGRRLFALVELAAAVTVITMDTGYPLAVPVQWALGLASVVSAVRRWHRAGRTLGTPAPSRAPARHTLVVLAGGVLAALILWALLRGADLRALRAGAAALPVWAWLAAVLGLLASYALRALRLQTEWGPRVGARFVDCLHLMLVHNAAVNLLPMRAGEAGYPWLLHRRFGVPVAAAAASLLRLRLQDVIVLGLFAIALLVPHGPAVAAGLAVAALALALTCGPALVAAAAPRTSDSDAAAVVRAGVRALISDRADAGASGWSWACAVANWLVKITALGGLLAALAHLSWLPALRGAIGGELAAVLPLQGPAGLGTYEGAVWAAVALHDRSGLAQLGAAALFIHLFALVVGLAAAAAVHAGSPRPQAAPAQEGSR